MLAIAIASLFAFTNPSSDPATLELLSFKRQGESIYQPIASGTIAGRTPGHLNAECSFQSSLVLPTGEFYYPEPRAFFRFRGGPQVGDWVELGASSISPVEFSPTTGEGELTLDIPVGVAVDEVEIHAKRSSYLPAGSASIDFVIGGRLLALDSLGNPIEVLHSGTIDLTVEPPDVAVDILEPFAGTGAQVLCTIELENPAAVQRDFAVSVSNPGVAQIRSQSSTPLISIPPGELQAHFFVQTHALGQYRIEATEGGASVAESVYGTVFPQVDAAPAQSGGGGTPQPSQFGSWFASGGGLSSMLGISGFVYWEPFEPVAPREPIWDECYPASVPPAMVWDQVCSGCVLINDIGTVSGPLAGSIGLYYPYSCEDWSFSGCSEVSATLDTPIYVYDSSEMYECGPDRLTAGASVKLEVGPAGFSYNPQGTFDWKYVNICHKYALDPEAGAGTVTVPSCQ